MGAPFLSLLLLCLPCAQDPRDLVEDLRSETPSVRDRAEKALRGLGRAAHPELEKAARDSDLEVATRAGYLLKVLAVSEKLTPRLMQAFPGLPDRLIQGGDSEATKVMLAALKSEGRRLLHPELTRADLDCLIATALLGAENDEDRVLLYSEVEVRRLPSASPILAAELGKSSFSVSRRIFLALLHVGTRAECAALEVLSREGKPEAREDALFLLGRLGAREHIAKCIEWMEHPDIHVKIGATWALQDLGLGGNDAALLRLLRHRDASVREQALIAVRTLGLRDAAPDIVKLLDDQNPEIRYWAALAAGQLEIAEAAGALALLLGDEKTSVRSQAALSLGRLGSRDMIPRILARVSDPESEVRISVVDALVRLKSTEAIPALERLLDDADIDVRARAMEALASVQGRRSIPTLRPLLRSKHEILRGVAAEILATFGDDEVASELTGLLRTGEPAAVCRVLDAIRILKVKTALPEVLTALNSEEWGVRVSALRVAGELGGPEGKRSVIERLKDRNPEVRTAAALCLCRLGSTEGVETLLEQGSSLFELNRLRSSTALSAMEAGVVPRMFGASRGEVVERIAKDLKLTIEWSTAEEVAAWRLGPAWSWWVGGGKRASDVIRELMGDRLAALVERDRIRVVTRLEGEHLWREWLAWKQEQR